MCSCRRSNHSKNDSFARDALGLKRSSDAGVFLIFSRVSIVVCKFVFCGSGGAGWVGVGVTISVGFVRCGG